MSRPDEERLGEAIREAFRIQPINPDRIPNIDWTQLGRDTLRALERAGVKASLRQK
jgi:hypothetical protein